MFFCPHCCDEVEVIIKSLRKNITIQGIEIDYKGKEAQCIECFNFIHVDKIFNYNQRQINEEYKIVRS